MRGGEFARKVKKFGKSEIVAGDMETQDEKILRAARILADTQTLMVFTGAGVSAESGFPTFRGKDGLWNQYEIQKMATPEGFAQDPAAVWEWYCWRRGLVLKGKPNPGHYAIAELERSFEDFLLVTQNVDNLHRVAGNQKIVELHGNIFAEKCTRCDFRRWSEEIYEEPPHCPKCGALPRPDVVWFGEPLDPKDVERAWSCAERADTIMVVGTSAVVYPAAQLPEIVHARGGRVIEVNLDPTPVTLIATVSIRGKSGQILPKIVEHFKAIS